MKKSRDNYDDAQEYTYDGTTTNASGEGTEWWETEEGIERMKAKELERYEAERNAFRKPMNLGRTFKLPGSDE